MSIVRETSTDTFGTLADEDYEYVYSDVEMDGSEDEESVLKSPIPAFQFSTCTSTTPLESLELGGPSIRMFSTYDMAPLMNSKINEVTEVLGIPTWAAIALMREHKWVKEHLFEQYYNDPERTQKSAGVFARCKQHDISTKAISQIVPSVGNSMQLQRKLSRSISRSTSRSRTLKTCTICFDELSRSDMIAMPCGHEFCRGCWKSFLEVMMADGPTSIRTTCPQLNCTEIVTGDEVQQAAPELLPRYESYHVRSFVEISSNSRWCPGPGCERIAVCKNSVITSGDFLSTVASCDTCATRFCIHCGEEPHSPMSCRDLMKWSEKCRNESETVNWILVNTKACPKCSIRIEKNQGCNHMTCQQCRFEFCWICMGSWEDHGGDYYSCNKFNPNDENDMSDDAKAKSELDRYLHYFNRYHVHAEAQKFAKNQLRETEARMVLLQEHSKVSTWTGVEFLKAANEQLIECRRVLKYSYSFAYFFFDDESKETKKQRFENHQEMLERFTEKLSELCEKPLAVMDKLAILDLTKVVDRYMKNVLKYVEDGMEDFGNTGTMIHL